MKCKICKKSMKECGFKFNNRRYECYDCNIRFVPFLERYFGNNFIGIKWEKIDVQDNK